MSTPKKKATRPYVRKPKAENPESAGNPSIPVAEDRAAEVPAPAETPETVTPAPPATRPGTQALETKHDSEMGVVSFLLDGKALAWAEINVEGARELQFAQEVQNSEKMRAMLGAAFRAWEAEQNKPYVPPVLTDIEQIIEESRKFRTPDEGDKSSACIAFLRAKLPRDEFEKRYGNRKFRESDLN